MKRKKSEDSQSKRQKVNSNDNVGEEYVISSDSDVGDDAEESPSEASKSQKGGDAVIKKAAMSSELTHNVESGNEESHDEESLNSEDSGGGVNSNSGHHRGSRDKPTCDDSDDSHDTLVETSEEIQKSPPKEKARPTKCDVCGRRFPSLEILTDHMKMHSEEEPCESESNSGEAIVDKKQSASTKTVDDDVVRKCEICGKRFKLQEKLQNHMKLHTGLMESESVAKISDSVSEEQSTGSAASDTENVAQKCDICGKRFTKAGKLQDHMKMHSDLDDDVSSSDKKTDSEDRNLVVNKSAEKVESFAKKKKVPTATLR